MRPACYLQHMKIAVAIARIEGFYGNCNQELALPQVAVPFAARRVTHTVCLMQRMRYVIRQSGLFQNPLAISFAGSA